ncbi:MAG: glycosyltransferase [Deltaproteobacteria bacterium]|nr:glycosyltransferase [Deltaproteobacteria bacterium]
MPLRLSVVVPFHDEADSLPTLYAELDSALSKLAFESEMIFVDDASRDESCMRLQGAVASDARVRVL